MNRCHISLRTTDICSLLQEGIEVGERATMSWFCIIQLFALDNDVIYCFYGQYYFRSKMCASLLFTCGWIISSLLCFRFNLQTNGRHRSPTRRPSIQSQSAWYPCTPFPNSSAHPPARPPLSHATAYHSPPPFPPPLLRTPPVTSPHPKSTLPASGHRASNLSSSSLGVRDKQRSPNAQERRRTRREGGGGGCKEGAYQHVFPRREFNVHESRSPEVCAHFRSLWKPSLRETPKVNIMRRLSFP